MKTMKALLTSILLAISVNAMAVQYVRPHVGGYYRSTPNSNRYDNYSPRGEYKPIYRTAWLYKSECL
jgi:hypothetical protein